MATTPAKGTKRNDARGLAIVRQFFPNVTKLFDADRGCSIEVLPKDVSSAKRKKHDGCALAQATKRQEHADGVVASISRVYVISGDTATRYGVSVGAAREITSFDRGASFEPGVYKLDRLPPIERLGAKKPKPPGKSGGRNKRTRHVTENVRAHV